MIKLIGMIKLNKLIFVMITLVLVTLASIAIGRGSLTRPQAVALAQGGADCVQLLINGVLEFESDVCAQTPTATPEPEPTETAIPPTDTPAPTGTATPAPTATEEPPASHDLNECHHPDPDNGIYHNHGTCYDDLPDDSPIKAWLANNPDWRGVGLQPHSNPTENLPFEEGGKHPGYNKRWNRYEECHQYGQLGSGGCVREIYFTFHSMLTPQALRTPGGIHSANLIAVICPKENYPASCNGGDRIIALREATHYGEPHASYKRVYCRAEGAVEYTNPNYHIEQPPYWAQVLGREPEVPAEFISSLRNAAIGNEIGQVNNLFQWAVSSTVWGYANPDDEDLCGDEANDIQLFTTTNPGEGGNFEQRTMLWTLKVMIEDFPRPHAGFTDRDGNPAPDCTETSFECAPIYIGADVPQGDAYFNFLVDAIGFRENTLPAGLMMDVTRPDTYAPYSEPEE